MKSRHFSVLGLAAGVLCAAMMSFAGTAMAAKTAPGYEEFKGCPTRTENASVRFCITSNVTGGHFQMGSKNVPITNPFTLSGGTTTEGGFVFNSQGGLSKARQKVPGGVVGLTGLTWLLELFGNEALTLYATTELAGAPSNPALPTFNLPIKVHLENGLLGNNCYVGSTANPISLNLTEGTTSPPPPNEPISGQKPSQGLDPSLPGVVRLNGAVLVDNSFSAPAASGCVLNLLGLIPINIDSLVDSQSGLPAAAGTNETVQDANAAVVSDEEVYPPEGG